MFFLLELLKSLHTFIFKLLLRTTAMTPSAEPKFFWCHFYLCYSISSTTSYTRSYHTSYSTVLRILFPKNRLGGHLQFPWNRWFLIAVLFQFLQNKHEVQHVSCLLYVYYYIDLFEIQWCPFWTIKHVITDLCYSLLYSILLCLRHYYGQWSESAQTILMILEQLCSIILQRYSNDSLKSLYMEPIEWPLLKWIIRDTII